MSSQKTVIMKSPEPPILLGELPSALMNGPVWLKDKRIAARDAFNAQGVPQRGLHLWRYTDPMEFLTETGTTSSEPSVKKPSQTASSVVPVGRFAAIAREKDGSQLSCEWNDVARKKGIVISTLLEAVASHSPIAEKHFSSLINASIGKLEARNTALWQNGIFVHIPKGQTVELPIFLMREVSAGQREVFPRLLIVVEENAEVTIIDEYFGGSQSDSEGLTLANGAVEIIAGANSRVKYVQLQQFEGAVHSYLTHRASIDRGGSMVTIPLAFGGRVTKHNFGAILNGAGAESNMYGLLFGGDRQHFDNHTLHHHNHGQTQSNIDFKVVLRDKAVSAYTGLIRIENGARTCEAYQENRNLLLTPGTKAETIPELEILNEDVKCTHGATIGPIDPMSIFYLGSRGIPKDEAVRMIVGGFIETTIKIVPEDIREQLSGVINSRLERL
ncbi:MAG: Fe-S cluster assembly protein SufD [Candidatus Zixiibacteriota bacterium]